MSKIKEIIKNLLGRYYSLRYNIINSGGLYVGMGTKIVNRGHLSCGRGVKIRPSVYLCCDHNARLVFGDNCEIGNHSTIFSYGEIVFGDGVLTAPNVHIVDHNHEYEDPFTHIYKQGVRYNPGDRVVIGDGSWLGKNVVVIGNVSIGKNCVIAANSVVTKDVPDYSIAAGIPARVIKRYDFDRREWVKLQ